MLDRAFAGGDRPADLDRVGLRDPRERRRHRPGRARCAHLRHGRRASPRGVGARRSERAAPRGNGSGPERVVALGECGLDYHYMKSPRDVQRDRLRRAGRPRPRTRDARFDPRARRRDRTPTQELLGHLARRRDAASSRACCTATPGTSTSRVAQWTQASTSPSRASSPSSASHGLREVAAACPSIACWSRPMRRFLAPRATAASATSRSGVGVVGETLAALHERPIDEIAECASANARRFYRLPA